MVANCDLKTNLRAKVRKIFDICKFIFFLHTDGRKIDTLFHSIEPTIPAARARDDRRERFGLTIVDVRGRSREILLRCGFDTEDTIAQFDDIEVYLKDPFFSPEEFDEHGKIGL